MEAAELAVANRLPRTLLDGLDASSGKALAASGGVHRQAHPLEGLDHLRVTGFSGLTLGMESSTTCSWHPTSSRAKGAILSERGNMARDSMPRDDPTEKRWPVIVAAGTDLVELARIDRLLSEQRQRFLAKVFTEAETEYCLRQSHPARSLGARFAAKEATMKCLGTGWAKGVTFTQIEVVRMETGAVRVELSGRAAQLARELRIARGPPEPVPHRRPRPGVRGREA